MRRLLEYAFALMLGHAAEHAKNFSLPRLPLEISQTGKHLLLGFVADAARIVEDQVSLFGRIYLPVAFRHQRADYLLGVVHIHLAAEGLDVESLGSHSPPIVARRRRTSGPAVKWGSPGELFPRKNVSPALRRAPLAAIARPGGRLLSSPGLRKACAPVLAPAHRPRSPSPW